MRHPLPDDPEHLGIDAAGVVIEVQRVDVLVFLGRVLGVRDPAVGPLGEPFRVLGHPGVVRGGLQGQVEGDFHAQLPGAPHERVEVRERAQIGMDRVVAPLGGADGPR